LDFMEGKISAAIAEHSRSEEEVLKYIYSNNDILSEVKTES